MGAVYLGGMAPDVVLPGKAESQLVVLAVVPADVDRVAVGAFKPHGRQLGLLHALSVGVGTEIPALLQLPADFLQLPLSTGAVQLLQHAFQVVQLQPPQLQLPCQLLLRVFHPGVVLIILGGVLVGGENGGDGNVHRPHFLVVEVLALNAGLPLHDAVEVGREDVPQLAQTLPVVGGFQLLFLNGQLFGQAAAQILNGLAHGLTLLPHGVLLIPDGVVHIQQLAKGLGAAALAVFPDGAEGELLRRAVREGVIIRRGVAYVLVEEQQQLVGGGVHVQRIDAGIRASGGVQRRLPAHQRGQAANGVHQPVGQNICAGGCKQVYITLHVPLRGVVQKVQLHDRLRRLIHETRQRCPLGAFVKADAPQAVQNPPLRGQ